MKMTVIVLLSYPCHTTVISFINRRNSLTKSKEPTKKLEPILPKGVINIVHRPKIITENVNSKLQ